MKPDFSKSALIIVDMQNDFLKPGGYFSRLGERPEFTDLWNSQQALVTQAITDIRQLAQAMRAAVRPVVYVQHVLREDYADACWPYWRLPNCIEERFLVDGTWGAQIIDELRPKRGEMVITKKGYGAFTNTPLNVYLDNLGITTCIMTGVGTAVCVETTTRQGADLNYYMVIVSDATADERQDHETSLSIMSRFFGDVMTTDEVTSSLHRLGKKGVSGQ
jgi:nicotinamidase-related amidase